MSWRVALGTTAEALGWMALALLVACGETSDNSGSSSDSPSSSSSGSGGSGSDSDAGSGGSGAGRSGTGGEGAGDSAESTSSGGESRSTIVTSGPSSSTGRSSMGGASSTVGTTGLGGSAGAPPDAGDLDCLEDGEAAGVPAGCEAQSLDNCCWRCAKQKCCEEYGQCFATGPYNICGSGEIYSIRNCMFDGSVQTGSPVLGELPPCIDEAVERESMMWCGLGQISDATRELTECLRGDEQGKEGCFEECFNPYFNEPECAY